MLVYDYLLIAVSLLLSFFFSASETALTVASRAKIHKLAIGGNRRARLVNALRNKKEMLISALLISNNTVNIMASAVGTAIAIHYFGDEGVIYATAVMTVLIVIFAEIMPKTYALNHAEKVALWVAPAINLVVRALYPVVMVSEWVSRKLMDLARLGRDKPSEDISGADALRGAIELHHAEGAVIKHDRDMLGSILDLGEMEVAKVMVHRKNMVTVNVEDSPQRIVEQMLSGIHTRVPVWRDQPDNIIGILHTKDLLRAMHAYQGRIENINIASILMEPWFIPATTTLSDQLIAFRQRRSHFALVIDEYGALLGLVTLEDILEEIVGQIDDEHDRSVRGIRLQADGSYIIDGAVTIRDLNRELEWNLSDNKATTLAGLLMHEAQLIPEIGQIFEFYGFRFTILKKHRNQITSIRVARLEPPAQAE